jgi:hypothetical protein
MNFIIRATLRIEIRNHLAEPFAKEVSALSEEDLAYLREVASKEGQIASFISAVLEKRSPNWKAGLSKYKSFLGDFTGAGELLREEIIRVLPDCESTLVGKDAWLEKEIRTLLG